MVGWILPQSRSGPDLQARTGPHERDATAPRVPLRGGQRQAGRRAVLHRLLAALAPSDGPADPGTPFRRVPQASAQEEAPASSVTQACLRSGDVLPCEALTPPEAMGLVEHISHGNRIGALSEHRRAARAPSGPRWSLVAEAGWRSCLGVGDRCLDPGVCGRLTGRTLTTSAVSPSKIPETRRAAASPPIRPTSGSWPLAGRREGPARAQMTASRHPTALHLEARP